MARTKKTAIFTRAWPLLFCSKTEPCGVSGLWLFIFKWHYCVCLLRCWLNLFASLRGFASKSPRAKSSCSAFRFTAAWSLFYRLCWGCRHGHPYLLISPPGKRLHGDVHGFENDPSSNKPVQAKLRRLKSHFSPLLPLLLATNPRRCKKQKDSVRHEFTRQPRSPETHALRVAAAVGGRVKVITSAGTGKLSSRNRGRASFRTMAQSRDCRLRNKRALART